MKKRYLVWFPMLCILMAFSVFSVQAQDNYSNFNELSQRLENLASEYSNLTNLQSLAESPGGHDIYVLTIGQGETDQHPAVAVIGGANGSHILGSELALQFAEDLLARSNTDSVQTLLEGTTFYVMPRINPDATEQYFADLKYERQGNATATDDDRDGAMNEDPPEDLNGDGLITMMRIANRTGDYTTLEDDDRIMTKIDTKKNIDTRYRLLPEGRDNDNDEAYNEDGAGGVNINKNFTFDYPNFTPGAGENMASQPETRAVLDFLYEQGWNVYAVVSFGPENNLSSPLSFNRGAVSQRVITGWYQQDIELNKAVSDIYNETIALSDAPKREPQPGDLFQWAYFHYGRLSFSTPGWWTPPVMNEEGKPQSFDNEEAHYLAWAEEQGIDAFVDWEQVNHPDFPDKTVQVGGIKPYRQTTPPYSAVDSIAAQHTDFIIKLGEMRPNIELVNVETEQVGDGLTRITLDLYNSGSLPTATRLGERTRWVQDARAEIDLSDNLNIVSGLPYQSFETIKAKESKTLTWLLRGSGTFTLTAGSPTAGFTTIEKTIQ